MGAFTTDREAFDLATTTAAGRIAMNLDGEPAPVAAPVIVRAPAAPAAPAAAEAAEGPGFWSRLSDRVSDLVNQAAAAVPRGIDGARANGVAALPPPRNRPSVGFWLALAAALLLILGLTRR